ncbi:hypothetical protein EOD39_10999 [Acipenser ruthenus]|uniref:CCHC-type domain-containing protein n=1 Tax=Acipenser ruthenus TaxID=7906 RepID=A0A662YSU3_ACIRT|nr:hypothetical protein EOD39_10999 [Acipenser ruthenus]
METGKFPRPSYFQPEEWDSAPVRYIDLYVLIIGSAYVGGECAGESLAKLASNLEREARRTYADSPAREQEEQACFQFVEAVGPGELRKHLRLSKPRSLQEAFQLAQEWEDISKEEDKHWIRPAVRATEVEVGPEQSGLGLAEVMEEIVTIRKAMAARPPPSPQSGPCLCWECGQPGHIRVDCWRRRRRADHPAVLAPNPARPAGNGTGSA